MTAEMDAEDRPEKPERVEKTPPEQDSGWREDGAKRTRRKVPVNWKKHSGSLRERKQRGKIEEYENEREGADVDSETACTDMRRAERMPAWRQEEDARKSKLSESRADVVNELNDDDWEQEELDEWDEPEKSPAEWAAWLRFSVRRMISWRHFSCR